MIVAEQTHNFSPDEALTAAQQLLPANEGVDVLALDCSFCVAPIIPALDEMGLTGLRIVSAGTDAGTVQEIKDGTQFGSVLLIPATEAQARHADADRRPARCPDRRQHDRRRPRRHAVRDGSIIATAANIGDFTAEWPLGA